MYPTPDIPSSAVEAMRQELEDYWRAQDLWFDTRWYTPQEWAERGEEYGHKAVLNLTCEGPLNHALNYGWEEHPPFHTQTRSQEIAEAHGYWFELGYAWSVHFYPR